MAGTIYTIYDGCIEQHEVIRKTPKGYTVKADYYARGKFIPAQQCNVKIVRERIKYVTEDRAEALHTAQRIAGVIQEKHDRAMESIIKFTLKDNNHE